MPHFHAERTVAHTAALMFDVVADVDAYPEFVPYCESLTVREKRFDGERTILTARMTVGYKFIRESFTTRVTLDPAAKLISATYVDGPFRHLDTEWRFIDRDQGRSTVTFDIDYAFRSRTLGALMGTVFDRLFRSFADAFTSRANRIYGAVSLK